MKIKTLALTIATLSFIICIGCKQKEEAKPHVHGPDCQHEEKAKPHVHGPDCTHDKEQGSCIAQDGLIKLNPVTVGEFKAIINQSGSMKSWTDSAGFQIQITSEKVPTSITALISNSKGDESLTAAAHSHGKTFHLHVSELPKLDDKSTITLYFKDATGKKSIIIPLK